jgi:osmotically-inducible protein OsmY
MLAAAAGCAAETDQADPRARAEEALNEERLSDVDLDWNEDNRVLHLKGSVASADERNRAEEIAEQAVGTSGRVLNELTVDDPAYYQPDNTQGSLEAALENAMTREFGADEQINFEVADNGAVRIKGRVATEAEKARAEAMTRSTQGVIDVVNDLEVGPQQ